MNRFSSPALFFLPYKFHCRKLQVKKLVFIYSPPANIKVIYILNNLCNTGFAKRNMFS